MKDVASVTVSVKNDMPMAKDSLHHESNHAKLGFLLGFSVIHKGYALFCVRSHLLCRNK